MLCQSQIKRVDRGTAQHIKSAMFRSLQVAPANVIAISADSSTESSSSDSSSDDTIYMHPADAPPLLRRYADGTPGTSPGTTNVHEDVNADPQLGFPDDASEDSTNDLDDTHNFYEVVNADPQLGRRYWVRVSTRVCNTYCPCRALFRIARRHRRRCVRSHHLRKEQRRQTRILEYFRMAFSSHASYL